MPRQPIIDAHEWISEIPTVPNCYSVKPQGKGTGLWVIAGKEDPVEFDSSLMLCSDMKGVAKVGASLLATVKYHYFHRYFTH